MNKTKLKQIIKEELETVLRETDWQKKADMQQRLLRQYAELKAARDAAKDPKIIEFPMNLFKIIEKDADKIRALAEVELNAGKRSAFLKELSALVKDLKHGLSVAKDESRWSKGYCK
jgi:hypothetical protein